MIKGPVLFEPDMDIVRQVLDDCDYDEEGICDALFKFRADWGNTSRIENFSMTNITFREK